MDDREQARNRSRQHTHQIARTGAGHRRLSERAWERPRRARDPWARRRCALAAWVGGGSCIPPLGDPDALHCTGRARFRRSSQRRRAAQARVGSGRFLAAAGPCNRSYSTLRPPSDRRQRRRGPPSRRRGGAAAECCDVERPPVRATSSPSAAPITAEHKAARLRRASIASDARRRFRKQEGMPMTDTVALRQPWYRGLNRHQWNILLAANLGWLFDGFELYALILTVGPAMRSLLDPSQYPQIPAYVGTVVAITLLGWGIGGIVGGVLADYIGRKRTMILAILAYSITTGLTAISFDWISFAILRFLVGIAIGSEWATGSSMMAELWPDHARGRGAGLMQCGIGIGNFVASFVWLYVSMLGPDSWRYLFLIGILPAVLTLWIRTSIPESNKWEEINERRKAARARQRSGTELAADEHALTRFTAADLFVNAEIRRRTPIALLLSLTTTLAWWGISSWLPPYAASLATKANLPAQQWAAYAGMAYNFGGILGYICLGFLADWIGRRPTAMIYFAMAFVMTPVLFLWTQDLNLLLLAAGINAFFTLGQYSWMPVWLPELFPTRSRGTGIAFVFNAPRFIAFLGPLFAGTLIVQFGGFGQAAMILACIYFLGFLAAPFLPETKGQPLPEDV